MINRTFNLISGVLLCSALSAQVTFLGNSTLLPGSYGSPACVVDMNGDHLDDVVRVNGLTFTVDYQQTDGSFVHSDFGATNFNSKWSICAGDLNNDGFNDVLLGDGNHVEFMYAINGGTDYQQVSFPDYIFSQRSTMNDIDKDGWLDAFVCHDVDQNHPFRNDGAGNLTEDQSLVPTASNPEGGNYAAIWVDYDNDMDQDLYITKCRSGAAITDEQRINQMYRNDGNGVFTEVAGLIGLRDSAQSWSTVFEDFDNDGDFDAFIVNHTDQNRFLENDGAGNFTDIIASTGINATDLGAWEAQAADFNNDGFIDIFSEVGGGLYLNNGNMTFTNQNISPDEGGIGDLNNDGWLDYQLGGTVYLNTGGTAHWIKIELDGIVSANNGIGSRIVLYGPWGQQTREVRAGQGFSHMNSLQAHFGIGNASAIDSVVVHWPSGIVTSISNPSIDMLHIIPEVNCILPSITLAANGPTSFCPGGSVILTAPNGYSSYQWSNGEATQSITAAATGNFSVLGFNAQGCAAISDQIAVTVIQESAAEILLSDNPEICDGDQLTITANSSLPITWNSTSTSTPSITVNTAGDYWATASGQCGSYNSDTTSVLLLTTAANPITSDVLMPAPGSASLNATGTNILWYDQMNATDSIGSGNTWNTPFVSQTTTYWAEANEVYPSATQQGGRTGVWSGGGIPASGGLLNFNAFEGFTINTVTVYAISAGVRTIELQNSTGATVASTVVNLPVGVFPVTLNFHVPAGSGYKLTCLENDLFRHNTGSQYPYAIGNVGEIVGSTNGPTYYYFFYDWTITPDAKYCASDRIPAVVDFNIGIEDVEGGLGLALSPNPTAAILTVTSQNLLKHVFIEIYDVNGSLVLQTNVAELKNQISINVSDLALGNYSLKATTEAGTTSMRFVIQR